MRRIDRVFNENNNVEHKYVMELVRRFEETGYVCNKKTTMERIVHNVCQIEVLRQVAMISTLCFIKISKLINISTDFVHEIFIS